MTPPSAQIEKEDKFKIRLHRTRGAQRKRREYNAAAQKPESREGEPPGSPS